MIKHLLNFLLVFAMLLSPAFAGTPDKAGIGNSNAANVQAVQVRFYPNPIINTLNIDIQLDKAYQGATVEVKIINMLGKVMNETFTGQINGLNSHFEIDLSDVPSGVYFVEIETTANGHSSKVTKRITKG